jgi:hypothetical protein
MRLRQSAAIVGASTEVAPLAFAALTGGAPFEVPVTAALYL